MSFTCFVFTVILIHKTSPYVLHRCHLQNVEEARKIGLVGNPALAPAPISMATQSAWTPLGVARPAVVRVTWSCRTERVCPGSSAAANTTTSLPLVRATGLLVCRRVLWLLWLNCYVCSVFSFLSLTQGHCFQIPPMHHGNGLATMTGRWQIQETSSRVTVKIGKNAFDTIHFRVFCTGIYFTVFFPYRLSSCEAGVLQCQSIPGCSVDGSWSQWGAWTECSHPCGGGVKFRRRLCDNPSPQSGGRGCFGQAEQHRDCNTHLCSGNSPFIGACGF